jgi:hypothetical protein
MQAVAAVVVTQQLGEQVAQAAVVRREVTQPMEVLAVQIQAVAVALEELAQAALLALLAQAARALSSLNIPIHALSVTLAVV